MSLLFGMFALIASIALIRFELTPSKDATALFWQDVSLWMATLSSLAAFLSTLLFEQQMQLQGDVASSLWLLIVLLLTFYRFVPMLAPLSVFIFPYIALLCVLALGAPVGERGMSFQSDIWFFIHIISALSAYGLLSFASLAAIGCLLRQRSLKGEDFYLPLPSIRQAEELEHKLLWGAVAMMGCAIISGFIFLYSSNLIEQLSSKILLSLLSFVLAVILLLLRLYAGVAGARAAHIILASWFSLTLAWLGVNFLLGV